MNEFDRKVILSKIDEIDFFNEDDKYLKIVEKSLMQWSLFLLKRDGNLGYWALVKYKHYSNVEITWLHPRNEVFYFRYSHLDKSILIDLLKGRFPNSFLV